MQKLALFLLLLCCLSSCKSTKRVTDSSKKTKQNPIKKDAVYSLADYIVENAKTFSGVKYKYGGITNKGMDCSGLVYVSFKKENIQLPRVSKDMAKKGTTITLREVQKGDLLFFQTNKNKKVINHVGLVVNINKGLTEFIHSTTSNGVIISSLAESYWKSAFIEARRIL